LSHGEQVCDTATPGNAAGCFWLIVILAMLQSVAPMASGDGDLFPPSVIGVGWYPTGIATADLDHDGYLDVVVSAYRASFVAVAFGKGDGTFEPADRLPVGLFGTDVVICDLDRNGFGDVVVLQANNLVVFANEGGRSFADGVQYWTIASGEFFESLAATDVNNDAIADLIVGGDPMVVYLGNPAGTLDSPPVLLPDNGGEYFVAPGDFDEDGIVDFATTADNVLRVWRGNGDGTFVGPLSLGGVTRDGRVGFFDDDSHLDLAVVTTTGVRVFLGTGDGQFGGPVDYEVVPQATHIEALDLDSDGDEDLVAMSYQFPDQAPRASVLLANGDGTFEPRRDFLLPAVGGPISAGDFDRDGHIDIIVASYYSNSGEPPLGKSALVEGGGVAFTLRGGGNGGFVDARPPFVGDSMDGPSSIAVGDFDGDGIGDFATASVVADQVSVVLGLGDGTFAEQSPIPVGTQPGSIVSGQFDGVAGQDLVTANKGSSDLSVLLSQGDGTFLPGAPVPLDRQPSWLVTADFDGDGALDLATANPETDEVSVLAGHGDGTFAAPIHVDSGIVSPRLLAVADLNGDDIQDLAIGSSADISVLVGNGDGTFAPGTNWVVGAAALQAISAGDLNRDGRQDLVVVGRAVPPVFVLYGDGAGGVAEQRALQVSAKAFGVAIADLDGNGWLDLAVAHNQPMVTVFLGTESGLSPGIEFFGGRQDSTDARPGIAVGEFNRDGRLDLLVPDVSSDTVAVLFNRSPVLLRFADTTTLKWPLLVGYDSFNVYRGALADLQDSDMDGLPDGAYGVCRNDLDPDITDNQFADDEVPQAGQGFFYLMSRVRDGVETELGATSDGLPRVPALPCASEK